MKIGGKPAEVVSPVDDGRGSRPRSAPSATGGRTSVESPSKASSSDPSFY